MTGEKLTPINETDGEIIREIEQLLGIELEQVAEVGVFILGYLINPDGSVTGLGFFNCEMGSEKLVAIAGAMGSLSHLTQLNLCANQLTDISVLGSLSHLTQLDLSQNQLTDISALEPLGKLTQLSLDNNQIRELPEWITQRGMDIYCDNVINSTGIDLGDNPLESPPVEIVGQGRWAVKSYFEQLAGGEEELYEAKLLIVGRGDVGKTWLVNRLVSGELPGKKVDKSTEGIDIHVWPIKAVGGQDFRVNFWDFGGQEIYHSTHQYFLTRRSLYIFVWDARGDDDVISFDYWLNTISLLGDNAPIMIVMNKCDERRKDIDQRSIKAKFANVVGFYEVSAFDGTRIDYLRDEIIRHISGLELVGNKLPVIWGLIRSKLESLEENCISFEKYLEICGTHGLDEDQARYLSRYLHDLGVFLHFEDGPVLSAIVFLNPKWATDAAYRVLDNEQVDENNGRFTYKLLQDIWRDYPQDKHAALLELMIKFEICFKLGDEGGYIVPELLEIEKPGEIDWDYQDNSRFEYKYEFMPAGIMERFIARNHHLHKGAHYWKYGVVLENDKTQGLVECERLNRRIVVHVTGKNRAALMGIIRAEIDHIHKTLNNPAVKQLVECNCSRCSSCEDKHYFELDKLVERLEVGRDKAECDESFDMVDIQSMLGDIVEFVVVTDEQMKAFTEALAELDDGQRKEVEKLLSMMSQESSAAGKKCLFGKLKDILSKTTIQMIPSLAANVLTELGMRHYGFK